MRLLANFVVEVRLQLVAVEHIYLEHDVSIRLDSETLEASLLEMSSISEGMGSLYLNSLTSM